MVNESSGKNDEVMKFQEKVMKLKLLVDNGVVDYKEFLEIRRKLMEEAKIYK